MADKSRPEQRFEDLLAGRSASASPQMEQLAKLASALGRHEAERPNPQFRRRLRSELLAQASMADEDMFAAALSGAPTEAPAEVRQLVAVASALEPSSLPTPDPAFRFRLRAHLVERAATPVRTSPAAWLATLNVRMRKSLRVVGATAMAAMMLMGSAVALVASQDAVPGDALYGIKRLHESARLLPMAGEAEGRARLDLAQERLREIEVLVERGSTDDALYLGALSDMDDLTTSGTSLLLEVYRLTRDTAITDAVRAFTEEQIDALTVLIEVLPPSVVPRAQDSLLVVERAATEVVRTLVACGSCPADPFFTPPAARAERPPTSAQCECEFTPAPTQPGGSSDDGGPNRGGGNDPDNNGGNGGNGTGPDPAVDLPDQLPDEVEQPAEDVIDDILDELDPLPTPSPTPTLPALPPQPTSSLPPLPSL